MITGYDPDGSTFTTGIGSLIEFGRLPDSLVPRDVPVGLAARQKAHARFQCRMLREGWEREVQLELELDVRGILFRLRGRADLVRRTPEGVSVVEVKTLHGAPTFDDPFSEHPEHVLQLMFYVLALEASGAEIGSAAMVYLPMTGRGRRPVEYPVDPRRADLAEAWTALLTETADWLTAEESRRRLQVDALRTVGFPFDTLRPGQEAIVSAVGEAVRDSGRLMVQAPTGTGKTAAVLAGALGESLPAGLTLFLLTAKNTHKRIVVETAGRLIGRGLPLRMLVLTSKAGLCARGREICFPDDCPFASGFASKVKGSGALDRLLARGITGPEELLEEALAAEVCPFELGLCLSTRCDLVCGDYNYAFDPHVFLKRFFVERQTAAACSVLVDEAANLPARARDYYSPEVRLSWLRAMERWRKGRPRGMAKLLAPWLEAFERWDALLDAAGGAEMELPAGVEPPDAAEAWTAAAAAVKDPPREFLDLMRSIGDFSRIGTPTDGRFHLLYRRDARDRTVQWFCTDPSGFLAQRIASCASVVAFSATLSPPGHFRDLLGMPEETRVLDVPYPFPARNLGVWVDPRVDTRWSARRSSAPLLVRRVEGIVRSAPGTWLVFLPSFAYLDLVRSALEDAGLPVMTQAPSMGPVERERFIARLGAEALVALVVAGGVFAEGVDIRSDLMRGAIVVSPSLPAMDLRSELLAADLEASRGDGFLHASVIPGMVRVIQAAGRLVRSPDERRVLVLVGRRFARSPYIGLLPPHWFRSGWLPVLSDGMEEIREFFAANEEGAAQSAAPRRTSAVR